MQNEQNRNVRKLIDLVKNARVCMLITRTEDISGKPMGINKIDEDGTMWFFTELSSFKVDELAENDHISIVIINENSNAYLMINGTAGLSFDRFKMKELWNPAMKAWFPGGLNEPDIMLIKVTPHEVNYWDNSASKMVVLFNILKAIVTGKKYEEGQHGKILL